MNQRATRTRRAHRCRGKTPLERVIEGRFRRVNDELRRASQSVFPGHNAEVFLR